MGQQLMIFARNKRKGVGFGMTSNIAAGWKGKKGRSYYIGEGLRRKDFACSGGVAKRRHGLGFDCIPSPLPSGNLTEVQPSQDQGQTRMEISLGEITDDQPRLLAARNPSPPTRPPPPHGEGLSPLWAKERPVKPLAPPHWFGFKAALKNTVCCLRMR